MRTRLFARLRLRLRVSVRARPCAEALIELSLRFDLIELSLRSAVANEEMGLALRG